MMGGHQVALSAAITVGFRKRSEALENDVLNQGSRGYHEMTAILDKIAAGELLGRRQDMATNQLLSHALEQLLARSKRQRDTEAATINMQLTTWRDGPPRTRLSSREPARRFEPGVSPESRIRKEVFAMRRALSSDSFR